MPAEDAHVPQLGPEMVRHTAGPFVGREVRRRVAGRQGGAPGLDPAEAARGVGTGEVDEALGGAVDDVRGEEFGEVADEVGDEAMHDGPGPVVGRSRGRLEQLVEAMGDDGPGVILASLSA